MVNCFRVTLAMAFKPTLGNSAAVKGAWEDELMLVRHAEISRVKSPANTALKPVLSWKVCWKVPLVS